MNKMDLLDIKCMNKMDLLDIKCINKNGSIRY